MFRYSTEIVKLSVLTDESMSRAPHVLEIEMGAECRVQSAECQRTSNKLRSQCRVGMIPFRWQGSREGRDPVRVWYGGARVRGGWINLEV